MRYIIFFLIVYAVIGFGIHFIKNGQEDIYPFFSWSLFDIVPSRTQADFSIRIVSAREVVLEKPVFFEKAGEPFVRKIKSETEYYNLIQSLGRAIKTNDTVAQKEIKNEIEKTLIVPVTYEIVQRTFNPITRWRENRFEKIETLEMVTIK